MANEEQKKAFASYMGTSGSALQDQGSATGTGNPYLFQQFPSLQGLPAAPTPPPAAPSSLASVPSYQGSIPGSYPQAGFFNGAFGQNSAPQRPPPLAEHEAFGGSQYTAQAASVSGSAYSPHDYSHPPSTNLQYVNPSTQHSVARGELVLRGGHNMASTRNVSGDISILAPRHMSEHHIHQQHREGVSSATTATPEVAHQNIPVLLCHVCSVCGRMRSAGFHRNHPVIPGKPVVPTPCRKCKNKVKTSEYRSSSYTRIRSCTADEPCAWPRESVYFDLDLAEHRGRRRYREDSYIHKSSLSRPRYVRRQSSQANVGLRALQQNYEPRRTLHETTMRVSSLSPGRSSRRNEVWPPPDIVSTFNYRRFSRSPLRRQSSRIEELSQSPPPRARSTRMVYGNVRRERRARSISPLSPQCRDEDAEARVMPHARAYRPVSPEWRSSLRASDESSSAHDSMLRERPSSPSRGILKPSSGDYETIRRRISMRDSQQSMAVEPGSSRVHFDHGREERSGLSHYAEDRSPKRRYSKHSRHQYNEDPVVTPLVKDFERVQIRQSSLSPLRAYGRECGDRPRRLSPSPPSSRPSSEVHVRYISPQPYDRNRTPRPPSSPSGPERTPYINYRHVPRPRSETPPRATKPASDHTSDSDSVHSGGITEVRSWRGIDENGKPAIFIEERTRPGLIEQESGRAGRLEYRPLRERV